MAISEHSTDLGTNLHILHKSIFFYYFLGTKLKLKMQNLINLLFI